MSLEAHCSMFPLLHIHTAPSTHPHSSHLHSPTTRAGVRWYGAPRLTGLFGPLENINSTIKLLRRCHNSEPGFRNGYCKLKTNVYLVTIQQLLIPPPTPCTLIQHCPPLITHGAHMHTTSRTASLIPHNHHPQTHILHRYPHPHHTVHKSHIPILTPHPLNHTQ